MYDLLNDPKTGEEGWDSHFPKDAPSLTQSLQHASTLLKQKKNLPALQSYMDLLAWQEPIFDTAHGICFILDTQRQFELSHHMIDFVKPAAPKHAGWDYLQAKSYFASGHMPHAVHYAKCCIDKDRDFQDAMLVLAEAYGEIGEWDKAIEHFEDYCTRHRNSIALYNRYAKLLKKGKFYDKALDIYQKAILLDGKDMSVFYKRATILMLTGQISGALRDITHVIDQQPTLHEAKHLKALLHMQLGEWQQGEEALKQLLTIQPSNLDALHITAP